VHSVRHSVCPSASSPTRDSSHTLPDSFISTSTGVSGTTSRIASGSFYRSFHAPSQSLQKGALSFHWGWWGGVGRGGVGGGGCAGRSPCSLGAPLPSEGMPELFPGPARGADFASFDLDVLPPPGFLSFPPLSQMPLWRPLAEAAQPPLIPCSSRARTAQSTL
jgi:hypothetical protein